MRLCFILFITISAGFSGTLAIGSPVTAPTVFPSDSAPTVFPSDSAPTVFPSDSAPTVFPSDSAPTVFPSDSAPTVFPSDSAPTVFPSDSAPTVFPSDSAPTVFPSDSAPTVFPSDSAPTVFPSDSAPTVFPSDSAPTVFPSDSAPTVFPSDSAPSGTLAIRSLVFPSETSTSYVEMIPEKPLSLKAFTLCMRVATELSGEREIILFAYRTRDYDELNVWRELDGRLSFYLSGDGVFFQVPGLGALQTRLCVTWDSSSGAAALFIDGRKSLTKIYRKGHTIRGGGRVLLGQDPDYYLGGFDVNQSFVGEISDVNLWDYVLSDTAVQDMMTAKRGNVLDWETVELRPNGEVVEINVNL